MPMSNSLVLSEMIISAPDQIYGADKALESLDVQINELQIKQNALVDVCNKIAAELEAYLITNLYINLDNNNKYLHKLENFNKSLSLEGNLIDWKFHRIDQELICIYEDVNKVKCNWDVAQMDEMLIEREWGFYLENGIVYSFVENVDEYIPDDPLNPWPLSGYSIVTIRDSILDSTLYNFSRGHYYYHIPVHTNNPFIDEYVNKWNWFHDYIVKPISDEGTYGTLDNIEKLNMAKNMINANKTKVQESITILQEFI